MTKKIFKPARATKGRLAHLNGLSERIKKVVDKRSKIEYPDFRVGDTVKVYVRIREGGKERAQVYEGTCIVISGGNTGSFVVRKISHGVGVERVFNFASPKIAKVEIVQRGRIRRSRLFYLRDREGKAARVDKLISQGEQTTSAPTEK